MNKILYYGDYAGTLGETVEQEAKYTKRLLKEFIFGKKKFKFEHIIDLLEAKDKSYDIFIFDFGGIGIGQSGMVSSLSRFILKLIEDKPNTLFVAWTSFTNIYLAGECEKELGSYPNLISRKLDTEATMLKIKEWIQVENQ